MNCNTAFKLLDDYIDGELGQNDAETLKTHLEKCPECQQEYQQLVDLTDLLKKSPTNQPDQKYWDETTSIINARTIDAPERITVVPKLEKTRSEFIRSVVSLAASIVLFATALFIGTSKDARFFAITDQQSPVLALAPFNEQLINNEHYAFTREDREEQIKLMIQLSPPGLLGKTSLFYELEVLKNIQLGK